MKSEAAVSGARAPALRTALRGLRGRCPACGEGRLYAHYLRLNRECPKCGASFARMETADVAPHLTIFLVGLVVTPIAVVLVLQKDGVGDWALWLVLALALALTLLLLPRVKGMLAALLWRAGREM